MNANEIWDQIPRKSVKQVRAKFNSGVCALVNVGKLLYASSKIGELTFCIWYIKWF